MANPPPLRRWAASRLRGLADNLEPPGRGLSGRVRAPLVRFGGRWWDRDELTAAPAADDPPMDVQPVPETPS